MRKTLTTIVLVGSYVAAYLLGYYSRDGEVPQQLENVVQESYHMEKAKDGDTFVIKEQVNIPLDIIRIIGINTPEKGKPLYNEATRALEEMIAEKELYFEADPNAGSKVSHDRAVLWPFYKDGDGKKVNVAVEMARKGYAEVLLMRSKKDAALLYEAELIEAQKEAQQSKRGIWAAK